MVLLNPKFSMSSIFLIEPRKLASCYWLILPTEEKYRTFPDEIKTTLLLPQILFRGVLPWTELRVLERVVDRHGRKNLRRVGVLAWFPRGLVGRFYSRGTDQSSKWRKEECVVVSDSKWDRTMTVGRGQKYSPEDYCPSGGPTWRRHWTGRPLLWSSPCHCLSNQWLVFRKGSLSMLS